MVGLNHLIVMTHSLYFIVLRRNEFNEPMDGIVYGVTVSLGFATYENYDYVFRLAEIWEIDPAQLAIRFCDVQQFVTSTIIGATTMDQLKTCINSVHLDLNKEIMNEIKNIHKEIPHPAP